MMVLVFFMLIFCCDVLVIDVKDMFYMGIFLDFDNSVLLYMLGFDYLWWCVYVFVRFVNLINVFFFKRVCMWLDKILVKIFCILKSLKLIGYEGFFVFVINWNFMFCLFIEWKVI